MARDLNTLKEALWQQFEVSAKKAESYSDHSSTSSHNHAIANRQAMAELAQGIVAIEKEQRESAAANPSFSPFAPKTGG